MGYYPFDWWTVWIENVTLTKGSVNRKKRCVGQTNEVLHCCCFLLRLLCLICMCCMMMRDCLFGEICILNIKYFLTNEEVDVPSVMNETNTPIQINTEIFMRSYLLICFSFAYSYADVIYFSNKFINHWTKNINCITELLVS